MTAACNIHLPKNPFSTATHRTFTNQSHAQHYRGTKHLQALKRKSTLIFLLRERSRYSVTDNMATKKSYSATKAEQSDDEIPKSSSRFRERDHRHMAETSESSDQSYTDPLEDVVFESPIVVRNGVYNCVACNKNMSGSIPLEAHEQSYKHCQLVEQWREKLSFTEEDDGMPKGCDTTFCSICKVRFSGPIPAQQHYISNPHRKKLNMFYRSLPLFMDRRISEEDNFLRKGCQPCRILCFTSTQHAEVHMAGQRHRQLVQRSIIAPVRDLPPLEFNLPTDISVDHLTSTKPRHYQKELFNQAMERRNAVIFLPTGTGKTLVAAMVTRAMLVMNPGRQIVFLVDKVLLCIQQSDYLGKELRVSCGSAKIPRIVGLCGGGNFPTIHASEDHISQHDVLVVTAEYFRNLLKNQTLRWENVSLIVFDETHHCHKDHPYNMIMKENYMESDHKPKIVGLSASPAGRNTDEATMSGLMKLLGNLGDAELACIVENEDELDGFKSKCELILKPVQLDRRLNCLLEKLKTLAHQSFERLLHDTELVELLQDRHIDAHAVLNSGDTINVLGALNELSDEPLSNSLTHLINYSSLLITAISHLRTGECPPEIEDFISKIDGCDSNSSASGSDIGLTDEELRFLVKRLVTGLKNCDMISSLVVEAIIKQLHCRFDKYTIQEDEPLALVMVQTRLEAEELTWKLNNHDFFADQNIQATKLVGHGGGNVGEDGKAGGMSVSKQREALKRIKAKRYQVVVATSVAEEGVDLPACDLVILLYTPATTTALVQLRGRTRRKHSRMVILQSDVTREDVDTLLANEVRMEDAICTTFNHQLKKKVEKKE